MAENPQVKKKPTLTELFGPEYAAHINGLIKQSGGKITKITTRPNYGEPSESPTNTKNS